MFAQQSQVRFRRIFTGTQVSGGKSEVPLVMSKRDFKAAGLKVGIRLLRSETLWDP